VSSGYEAICKKTVVKLRVNVCYSEIKVPMGDWICGEESSKRTLEAKYNPTVNLLASMALT